MKARIFLMITIMLFVLPLDSVLAKDDKALRKQRQEANKERNQQKRDRAAEFTDANRSLQELARDLKTDYQEQMKDLDIDFQLREVELKADRDKKKAAADAEYQKLIMGLFTGAHDTGPDGAKKLQEKFKQYSDENFRIKKEGAALVQQERVAIQKQKNELLDKRDQEILDEAESLGLTKKPEPILAEPIGGELTKSEKSWNEREQKEVVRIYERHQRTLREYRNGKALRDWELSNMEEDFKLKWQEKEEIHKVQAKQMYYNTIMTSATAGKEVDRQKLMDDLAELQKKVQNIRIDHSEKNKKNQILRRKERNEIRNR